eukprot:78531-Pelagomonas_calceolata.AAC.4
MWEGVPGIELGVREGMPPGVAAAGPGWGLLGFVVTAAAAADPDPGAVPYVGAAPGSTDWSAALTEAAAPLEGVGAPHAALPEGAAPTALVAGAAPTEGAAELEVLLEGAAGGKPAACSTVGAGVTASSSAWKLGNRCGCRSNLAACAPYSCTSRYSCSVILSESDMPPPSPPACTNKG